MRTLLLTILVAVTIATMCTAFKMADTVKAMNTHHQNAIEQALKESGV
jgi:hypothetical protein